MFKQKMDNTYKTRVVAQGWGQVADVDCGGTFVSVGMIQSIHMVLAIATEKNVEIQQLPVQLFSFTPT